MTFADSITKIRTASLISSAKLYCRISGSLKEIQGDISCVSLNFRGLQEMLQDMMCAQPRTAHVHGGEAPEARAGYSGTRALVAGYSASGSGQHRSCHR